MAGAAGFAGTTGLADGLDGDLAAGFGAGAPDSRAILRSISPPGLVEA